MQFVVNGDGSGPRSTRVRLKLVRHVTGRRILFYPEMLEQCVQLIGAMHRDLARVRTISDIARCERNLGVW